MTYRDEETYGCLMLRDVRRQTIDALYEAKALMGLPICQLVDEIVWWRVKEHLSMPQTRLSHGHNDTDRLTLRRVRRRTIEALYELKARTGLPIYRLVDLIVAECTDPLTTIDIPNLLRQTGDTLEDKSEADGVLSFRIRKT